MYSMMLKEIFETTEAFKFCWVIYSKECSSISFSGDSYRMEVSELACGGDLSTGSCVVLAFDASNFCTSLLVFSFIYHSLQNQHEMALPEMITMCVRTVAASVNIM